MAKLIIPINPKTNKPFIEGITVITDPKEADKAKEYMKEGGFAVMLLEVAIVDSHQEFCEEWKTKAKQSMLASLGMAGTKENK